MISTASIIQIKSELTELRERFYSLLRVDHFQFVFHERRKFFDCLLIALVKDCVDIDVSCRNNACCGFKRDFNRWFRCYGQRSEILLQSLVDFDWTKFV